MRTNKVLISNDGLLSHTQRTKKVTWEIQSTSEWVRGEARAKGQQKAEEESLDDHKHAYVIICDSNNRQPTEWRREKKPELFRQSKKRDLTRWEMKYLYMLFFRKKTTNPNRFITRRAQ